MKRGAVILNGISRQKKFFYADLLPKLAARFPLEVFETEYAGHAIVLAREATLNGFDCIVAAGGDGTLNQVLNGILSAGMEGEPAIGLIPLGSGNDFARTCRITVNVAKLISIFEEIPRPTDIGILTCRDANNQTIIRFFLNCCSLGMGPDVVQRLQSMNRNLGPSITYLTAIVTSFLTQQLPVVTCSTHDSAFTGKIRVLAIANGKTFGHAIYIAPDADPGDGDLNLFVAGNFSTLKFLFFLMKLKFGLKIKNPGVRYSKSKQIILSSKECCAIETEGELAGFLPAQANVLPARIRFYRVD